MRPFEHVAADYAAARSEAVRFRNELFEHLDEAIVGAAIDAGRGSDDDLIQDLRLAVLKRIWLRHPMPTDEWKRYTYGLARREVSKVIGKRSMLNEDVDHGGATEAADAIPRHADPPPDRRLSGEPFYGDDAGERAQPTAGERERLQAAISGLPSQQRRVAELAQAGASISTIATALEITNNSARLLLSRGRRRLKSALQRAA